jgi:hypothetical protein
MDNVLRHHHKHVDAGLEVALCVAADARQSGAVADVDYHRRSMGTAADDVCHRVRGDAKSFQVALVILLLQQIEAGVNEEDFEFEEQYLEL